MGYECSEYMYPHLNTHNSSTRSHTSGEENRSKIASVNGPYGLGSPLTHHAETVTLPFVQCVRIRDSLSGLPSLQILCSR